MSCGLHTPNLTILLLTGLTRQSESYRQLTEEEILEAVDLLLAEVMADIGAHPGATPGEIGERTGYDWRVVEGLLQQSERFGAVQRAQD